MADREASLRLLVELVGAEAAAKIVAAFPQILEATAAAAQQAGGKLAETAEALDSVATAEGAAADESGRLASSLEDAGEAATATGQKTASAASGSAAAVEGVTASTKEQAAATRAAGAAAVESGEEIEEAAREAGSAVDQLSQDWKETLEAARAAGLAFDGQAAKESVEEWADAIVKSGDSLDQQKAALEGIAAGITEHFREMGGASEEAGDETVDQAKLMEDALASVRTRIAEVDAEMRKVGAAAGEGAREAESSFLSVDAALKLLNASAADTEARLTDTGRVPKAEIRELVELIETVNIAMEQTAGTSTEATAAQVANLERVKGRVAELNEISARQLDATQDNTVALKDEAGQVQALTQSLNTLIGTTGNAGTAMSSFATKGAGAFVAFDNAKNAVAAMKLNTLQLGTASAAGKTQIGLLITTLAAAAAAGFQAASANRENAQSMSEVERIGGDLNRGTLGRLKDGWDGLQKAVQDVASDLIDITDKITLVENSNLSWEQKLVNLAHSLTELTVGLNQGRTGIDLYNGALKAGATEAQAMAIAMEDSGKVHAFYLDSIRAGAKGQELWAQVIRESEGDTKKLTAAIRAHRGEMQAVASSSGRLTAAFESERAATNALSVELRDLHRVLAEDPSPHRTATLSAMAESLAKAAGEVKALTAADRDRLALIDDILARGADMTKDQERIAEGLIRQAYAGKSAAKEVNALIRLYLDFSIAANGTTADLTAQEKVLATLTDGWSAHRDEVRQRTAQAAADMQAMLDATDQLTESQRAHFQAEIDWLNAVEAERSRIEDFAATRTARGAQETVDAERRVREAIQARLTDLREMVPLSGTYADALGEISGELADLAQNTTGLSRADRERLEIIASLIAKGDELTGTERAIVTQLIAEAAAGIEASRSLNALAEAKLKVAEAGAGLSMSINGSSVQLNLLLAAIRDNIGAGEQYAPLLERLAASAAAEADSLLGLTNQQRERIKTVIELTQRSEELTQAEKRYVEQLITSIETGNRQNIVFRDYAAAEKERTDRINEQLDAVREQIALAKQQLGITEDQTQAAGNWYQSLSLLEMQEKALQNQQSQGLTVVRAANAEKEHEASIAIQRLKTLHEEAMAHERVRSTQSEVIKVVENGKTVYTNLTHAQNLNIEASTKTADAHGNVAKNADQAAQRMRDLEGTIPNVTVLMDGLREKSEATAAALAKVDEKIRAMDEAAKAASQ